MIMSEDEEAYSRNVVHYSMDRFIASANDGESIEFYRDDFGKITITVTNGNSSTQSTLTYDQGDAFAQWIDLNYRLSS